MQMQPPLLPPQEMKPNLEEILSTFLKAIEMDGQNMKAFIRNLEVQTGLLSAAILNKSPESLPSDTK